MPVVWFSLLDVGSYNFAAYISRKNVRLNNRSDLGDAMLDENENSSGRYCCSRLGSYSQALKAIFYHNIHPSRIDCRRFSRRNLPWGQPFTLPWTLHRGEVLNAGKTTSSENSSVRGPVETFSGGNTCITSFKYNRVSIPPKRFRFWLSDARECHSYLQGKALVFNSFTQELSTIGFLYLSKG